MLTDLATFDPGIAVADLDLYTRVNRPENGSIEPGDELVSIATLNNAAGTWDAGAVKIALVVVKAGDQFEAQYYGVPGTLSGSWTTAALGKGKHEVSHMSFYTVAAGNAEPVPEPSTMFLLGGGLIACGLYGRRRSLRGSSRA